MAESKVRSRRPLVADPEKERFDWLRILDELVATIEGWVKPNAWATRRIEKEMPDSLLGEYKAPALLMQREIAKVLLEPITRFAPETDGVVDLYLMPAYDDVATLYRVNGEWRLHSPCRGVGIRNGESESLTKESFLKVMEAFAGHAE